LKDALAIVRQIEGKEEQVWILKRLTPHLSEPLVREALAVVREVNGFYRYYMEDALVKLVSRLAELGYSEEALTLVQEMTCDERRAEALAGLAPHLPQTLLVTALAVALELPTSGGGYGVDLRGRALDGLSPYLPASLLQEALMTTREILDQDNRAEVLAGLCQHLPDLFLQESLAAARAIGRIDRRAKVLAELATNLSGAERENVLQEALVAVQEIKNARTFAEVLIELSPRMPQMPFSEVLMTVVDAGTRLDFEQRLEDLALAASQLTDSRLREMLAATQKIKLPEYRMWTLAKLVSYLPETEREEALRETLAVARMVRDSSDKRLLLLELVPKLAALGYPKDALQEALLIEDEELRAEVLAELAPYLPMRLLRDALMVAWETERKWARATVLAGLAPHLSEPEKEAIWQEVSKVLEAEARDDRRLWKRWRGLGMLVAYLPESLLQEVLKEALEIEDWDSRMAVLTRLAPRMAELGYPQQTTKVAREIRLEHFQKPVLIDLAALLAELSYFQEALDVTRQIQYPDHQAKAIIGIASYLPDPLLQEALLEARSIWEKTDRAIALIGLSPCLVGLSCETLFSLWCETLAFLSRRTREDLLADLLALAPVIAALGGMEAIAETFRAIQDVGRWWP
jgi:hypothetical protein